MNYLETLDQVKAHAAALFQTKKDDRLIYHNLQHTEQVVKAVVKIANHYQLSDQDFFVVSAAAWFHDIGYLTSFAEHEARGAESAREFLTAKGLDPAVTEQVLNCILATKMPQHPVSLLEQIVCDADLFHLGGDNFKERNKLMRKEVEAYFDKDIDKNDWRIKTIALFENHHYHTEYCQDLLTAKKLLNLQELKDKAQKELEKAEGMQGHEGGTHHAKQEKKEKHLQEELKGAEAPDGEGDGPLMRVELAGTALEQERKAEDEQERKEEGHLKGVELAEAEPKTEKEGKAEREQKRKAEEEQERKIEEERRQEKLGRKAEKKLEKHYENASYPDMLKEGNLLPLNLEGREAVKAEATKGDFAEQGLKQEGQAAIKFEKHTEQDREMSKKDKDKDKKKKSDRPDKGIETMFRITSGNQQRLSDMADNKAHIMISTNSIILSVILSILLRKLEDNPHLIIPTLILLIICVVTMVFSILATRPTLPEGTFTKDDVADKKVNLLFFGNFYKMALPDYFAGMEQMMEDRDYLYGSLIKDLYSQGVVLGRKYHLLRIAYNVFMFGIIASVLAFMIAAGWAAL